MKNKSFLMLASLLFLLAVPLFYAEAGFMDFLKDTAKSIGVGTELSDGEIISGLKEALQTGTSRAVESVSKVDGYYKNPDIKILLPETANKAAKLLRAAGLGSYIDEFELSMNRAAEAATPRAKELFWDAVKMMTFSDARKILSGRENEATMYLKDKTYTQLGDDFLPIVKDVMGEVGVTKAYQNLDSKVRSVPFAGSLSFDLDKYVTGKALDGLFMMLAAEEKKIRENPAARGTELLKKVFGNK